MTRFDARAWIRGSIRRLGFDLRRYPPVVPTSHAERRAKVLAFHGIDVVLDVGANRGQYASELRRHGYRGTIVSFEPLGEAFRDLERQARTDPLWRAENLALGATSGTVRMNVSENLVSSSILEMRAEHSAAAPSSAYVGTELVRIERLDDVYPRFVSEGDRVALKLDVQGFEKEVLSGAGTALAAAQVLEIEMSLVELYAGETLMTEMIDELRAKGLALIGLEPGLVEPASGHLLQVDGLFVRASPGTR